MNRPHLLILLYSVSQSPMVVYTKRIAAGLRNTVVCMILWVPLPIAAQEPPVAVGGYPQEIAHHRDIQSGLPSADIRAVYISKDRELIAVTAEGTVVRSQNSWKPIRTEQVPTQPSGLPANIEVRQWDRSMDGLEFVATNQGILTRRDSNPWEKLVVADSEGRHWAVTDVRGVTFDIQGRLWFASLAGVGCRDRDGWRFYTGNQGLPYNDFTCCAAGGDGSVWFGTRRGAIRFHNNRWSYRQGLRWLPDDEVRGIAVDAEGGAWFATSKGVGWIERKTMTLAEKAAYFEDEIERLIKRTPYGYVSNARLLEQGDKSRIELHDNDNDGLWTAMYGAGECYAYAATNSAQSRTRAKQAFEALRFLQVVTQGGDPSPPHGYVARTILPTSGLDPNVGQLERDRKMQAQNDKLWKSHFPRWPKSADGKWYWKSDTSSDELDGHYFFYGLYFDLVADTPEEKQRVRQVVADLTDHLIENDFVMLDHDGQPTRWANYRPQSLNHDFDWMPERGLNSLSILSYLGTARHITGDERYAQVADHLRKNHAFHMNVMVPKVQRGIGSGNQSDDEMAFMSFYNLVKYCDDPELRRHYLGAFYWYWMLEQPERNPFFHFAYAAFSRGQSTSDAFGTHDLSPWGDWLQDSVDALKGFSLDRINWAHTNSHRIDLVQLPLQSGSGHLSLNTRGQRGHLIDGKVLPVEERFFSHWNTDPWRFDTHGSGHELSSGTVFLLPYYMGRYHGFIKE